MQTYLGGGNSNILYFLEIWGCMIPKFDYIMFFKWVGSTTNQITATSQPQPICVFHKKGPCLKTESPFPRPIILGIHVSFRVCVGLEGPSNNQRKVTQEQLHVLEQFLAADLPAWHSQRVVPPDAGGWKPTANDAIFNGISGLKVSLVLRDHSTEIHRC